MFPFFQQYDASDCGPACLQMIIKFYGKDISLQSLRNLCYVDREGVSIKAIQSAGEKIGLKSVAVKSTITKSKNLPSVEELALPCIAYWDDGHFIVLYKISNDKVFIADPAEGRITMTMQEFKSHFYGDVDHGKIILFEPTALFHNIDNQYFENQILSTKIKFIKKHIAPIRKRFAVLFLIILGQLIAQAVSPYLTQVTFDSGILQKDINVLVAVLVIQIFIFLFNSGINYIESIISNKIAQEINFSFAYDFIQKIFKIPLSVYQQKRTSDFIHRVYDLNKIESFLTYNFSSILLSLLGFIVLSIVTLYYSTTAYLIFIAYNVAYAIWIAYSIRKKKELDYEKFDIKVSTHRYLSEMIEGIQEIKLNGNEKTKIRSLLTNQKKNFVNDLKHIKISQFLAIGGGLINNLGYGYLTFYTASLTINDTISIGEMAAIQLLISELNGMLSGIFSSASLIQEIKFSLERILETQSIPDEPSGRKILNATPSIVFDNVSFSYTDVSTLVIRKLSFTIEFNKTTAIVGISGSGKTTLMKLALSLCKPTSGNVLLDNIPITEYDISNWRKKCGVVMQDGYIFTDTIVNNVTESDDQINFENYENALKLASLHDFVTSLPIQHETVIGKDGLALSSGQRQRILIARLIYKRPDYIFMDEATNSLDSETERTIINNLDKLFATKTRLIIAHRLNTVRNADKIIVIHEGTIAESGSHNELIKNRGYYFELIKEQLQLS